MTVLTVIFTALFVFLIGFFAGVRKEPPIKAKKSSAKLQQDLQTITKEYQNFLNYDGSEQQ